MKNVLIVSYYFPPLNFIAARRFGNMVKYMEEFGWKPWILTTNSEGPLLSDISEDQIIRIEQITAGTYSTESQKKRTLKDGIKYLLDKVHIRNIILFYRVFSKKWNNAVLKNEKEILKKLPEINMVIGTLCPFNLANIAEHFADILRVKWIVDFRDYFLSDRTREPNILVKYFSTNIAKNRIIRNASAITTVSPSLAKLFYEQFNIPTEVIYNGWDPRESKITVGLKNIEYESIAGMKPYLYYAGTIYDHMLSSLFVIFKMLTLKPNLYFVIRFMGRKTILSMINDKMRKLKLEDRIKIFEPCEPQQVNYEGDNSLTNIVLETLSTKSRISKGTLTGKLFGLLPFQAPILAVARTDSDIGKVLEETKKGRLCSTVEQTLEFIDEIENCSFNAEGDTTEIEKYSKREQAKILCKLLDTLTSTKND